MARQSNEPPTDTLHDIPDWDLVTNARTGDLTAITELYHRHKTTVYRYIRSKVGDPDITEDLAADVWVRVVRALRVTGTVADIGKTFAGWLIAISKNIIFDYFKSSAARTTSPVDLSLLLDYENRIVYMYGLRQSDDPATVVADRDIAGILRKELDLLKPSQREVLTLRYLNDFSVAETSEITGKTVGATKALTRRAIGRLAQLLSDDVGCDELLV